MKSENNFYKFLTLTVFVFCQGACDYGSPKPTGSRKLIAIANLAPHETLTTVIREFKNELERLGYKPGIKVDFVENQVNYDQTLINTMLESFKAKKPDLVLTLTTSVSQNAQRTFKRTPIVFTAVTDPVEAKLVPVGGESPEQITGVSDLQNIHEVLKFMRKILPKASRVGVPYLPAEANDLATLRRFQNEGPKLGMEIVALPIDNIRDVTVNLHALKNKADCIYVSNGSLLQASFPAIATTAAKLSLPIFDMSADGVRAHQALASFSVSYEKVGIRAARIAAKILEGQSANQIPVVYPELSDHEAFLSRPMMEKYKVVLPEGIPGMTVYEK